MDMMVAQLLSGSATVPGTNANGTAGKSGTSQLFGNLLEQQGKLGQGLASSNAGQSGESKAVGILFAQAIAAGEVQLQADGNADSQLLLNLIDDLLQQLEPAEDVEQLPSKDKLEDMKQLLDELNALLTLLGMQPVLLENQQKLVGQAAEAEVEQLGKSMQQTKSALQDAFILLQVSLQQGVTRQLGQVDLQALIQEQVIKAQALLNNQSGKADSATSEEAAMLKRILQGSGEATSPAETSLTSNHLQRLAAQHVNTRATQATVVLEDEQARPLAADTQKETLQPIVLAGALTLSQNNAPTVVAQAPTSVPVMQVPISQFSDSFSGMVIQKLDVLNLVGKSEARMQLYPEKLGMVEVKLTMQDGTLTALFQADSKIAKELLEGQLATLRLTLQSQGLTVDKMEVTQAQPAADLQFQQQQGRHSEQQASLKNAEGSFDEEMQDIMQELEQASEIVKQRMGFGRGISTTA